MARRPIALWPSRYAQYDDIITVVRDGRLEQKPVTVIVSGDRPRETIAAEKIRYVGIDGRLADLESKLPSHLLPLISDNWSNHFKWRGEGDMPRGEKEKLAAIVERAHAAGRRSAVLGRARPVGHLRANCAPPAST